MPTANRRRPHVSTFFRERRRLLSRQGARAAVASPAVIRSGLCALAVHTHTYLSSIVLYMCVCVCAKSVTGFRGQAATSLGDLIHFGQRRSKHRAPNGKPISAAAGR